MGQMYGHGRSFLYTKYGTVLCDIAVKRQAFQYTVPFVRVPLPIWRLGLGNEAMRLIDEMASALFERCSDSSYDLTNDNIWLAKFHPEPTAALQHGATAVSSFLSYPSSHLQLELKPSSTSF